MTTPLYAPTAEILRLTTANPYPDRLVDPAGTAERRSPLCGSRVVIDVEVDAEGRVSAVGSRVNACAFGQAAATIVLARLIGRDAAELRTAADAMAAWMKDEGPAPDWPGIDELRPERLNAVRRGSVQLAFQAAADALAAAGAARGA